MVEPEKAGSWAPGHFKLGLTARPPVLGGTHGMLAKALTHGMSPRARTC